MSNSLKHIIDRENTVEKNKNIEVLSNSELSESENLSEFDNLSESENLSESNNDIHTEDINKMISNDQRDIGKKYNFYSKWNLWYHHSQNNWRIEGYKNIFIINNIKDYWDLHNNIYKIGGINNQHFFLMRDGIDPIWEDENNKNGGCWSIKLSSDKSYDLWEKLSLYIVGESLIKDTLNINGLSICLKNNTTSVIKIWNNNYNNNSLDLLHKDILDLYGMNILYKSHVPEY